MRHGTATAPASLPFVLPKRQAPNPDRPEAALPNTELPKPDLNAVQVVARTPALAEVRIVTEHGEPVAIGNVRLDHDSWYWVHNDGEQSSPVAATRLAAARALADYHRAYKPKPVKASLRDLLQSARTR